MRLAPAEELGQLARAICEGRGGLYVKLGQLLSLQPNVPASVRQALTGLQSRNGVGSIGGVVREQRHGLSVAVKRRTPGVIALYEADLADIERLVWWLSWGLPRLRLQDALGELRRVVDEELNFLYEASNQQRMRKTLEDHTIRVPYVFLDACADDTLVSEWVDGVLMADFLAWPDVERSTWCAQHDTTQKRFARTLIDSWFRQVFEDNLFHGDLHPGNIMLGLDGRPVLIDFGSVGSTELAFLDDFRTLARTLAGGNYAWAADLVFRLCAGFPEKKKATTKTALVRLMQAWVAKTAIKGLPYHQKSLNAIVTDLMTVVMAAGGTFQWAWLRIQRTLTTLDASLAVLSPGINYQRVVADYFAAADRRTPLSQQLKDRTPEYVTRSNELLRLTNDRERQRPVVS